MTRTPSVALSPVPWYTRAIPLEKPSQRTPLPKEIKTHMMRTETPKNWSHL